MLRQRRRGKAVLGENPLRSLAWKTPEISEAFAGCAEAIGGQCCYGLQHPTEMIPMKKGTRFMGQETVVKYLRERCPGDHQHAPIEGSFKDHDGRWRSLSEWAGGYPPALCRAMLKGAAEFLKGAEAQCTYVEDPGDEDGLSEGEIMDGEDTIEQERGLDDVLKEDEEPLEDGERHPVPLEVQRAVEFAHRQLGHPSRTTLIRMLKMSGATEEAVRHARRWHCQVCAQRKAPKHPQAAAPSVRPYGFNKHIHVDVKYLHDCRKKRYCCLSMLCIGTMKHDACMLKTRRSDYVAKKFFRRWCSQRGPPEKVTLDQGGEFEQTFCLFLEQMAVPSVVTAARAGWQLSAGERHGGILGNLVSAIVAEHSVEGYHAMKEALSAAISGKNSTMTKDGYTPNARVYGTEVRWPSLTDEEVKLSFAQGL